VTRPGAVANGEFVCDSDACVYFEKMRAAARKANVRPCSGYELYEDSDEEYARRPFDLHEHDYCGAEDYDY
jgi:hypothetical protein